MAKGSRNFRFPVEAVIFFALLGVLFAGWLTNGPSNQELLANYAKSKDLWDLIVASKGFAWWSPNYLGGAPTAPLAGMALSLFWMWLGGLFLPPLIGGKIMGFLALLASGLLMAAFLRRLTGDVRAAWVGAFFYALGPQAVLRLAGNEHMPVVFCLPYPPLIGWALLEITTRNSGRGIVILAMATAAMSLTFNKIAVVFGPVALGLAIWLHQRYPSKQMPLLKGCLFAAGIWVILGVLPQLPALRETAGMTLFSTDPLDGWQSSFSIKSSLSWFDRGGLLTQGMPPNFTVEAGGFYLGLVMAVATAIAVESRRRGNPSPLDAPIRIFLGLLLLVHWFSLGPRSGLGGILEFLKSAQGLQNWVLPFFWIAALSPIAVLAVIWPKGRWRWPTFALGLAVYMLMPGFQIFEMIPLIGAIRAPWSFWQVGGAFCLAAAAGVAVARLCPGNMRPWIPPLALLLAALDFSAYYAKFYGAQIEGGTYEAFEQTGEFLKAQHKPGAILPLSGRYFYLQLPQITERPLSTEAFQSYLMSKGMRALQDGGGGSADLMKISLSAQGVRYIFIDRKDVDTPEPLQTAFRQQYPVAFENEFFTVLENPNCLAPGFLARNYVSIPKDSYAYSSADLGLIRLYFLPVELTRVEMNDPTLAGVMNTQNGEVELTQAFRDREGDPFRILDAGSLKREGPNRIRVSLPGEPFWVTMTQAWHPDWKVRVDGHEVELSRIALALAGFRAPPGSREATLSFESPFWTSAVLFLGLIGWVGGLSGAAYLRFGPVPKPWKLWWEGEELELETPTEKTLAKKKEEKGQGTVGKIQKFLVIMPTYNEGNTIQQVLEEVQSKAPGAEILVVDDNSPDGTAAKVKQVPNFGKKIHLLERPGKAGLGSAYKEGFQWAMKRGYDAVVEMDADLSHDPADVSKLLQALNDGADLAVGSRYLHGVRVLNWPQSRLWVSSFGGWYARMLTGLPMTDPTSGFKAIRRRVLERLDWEKFTAQGYGFQIEIHFLAWQGGFRMVEVPIVFTERREGQSKMSLQIAQEAALRVLQLAVRRIFP